MKKLLLLLLLITTLITLNTHVAMAQFPTSPIGYYSVKFDPKRVLGMSSYSFENHVKNATYSSPFATVNLTSIVSATEASYTGTLIFGSIESFYDVDSDVFRVDSVLSNGFYITTIFINISLSYYGIFNESWVKFLNITVWGNTSILCDTSADVYLYNYTSGDWLFINQLNNTSLAHVSYVVPFGSEETIIDEKIHRIGSTLHYDTVQIKILHNDSSTSFTTDIECIKVEVNYQFDIEFENWTFSQDLTKHPDTGYDVFIYFNNLTLVFPDKWPTDPVNDEAPPGNYTIKFETVDESILTKPTFDITLPNQYCSYVSDELTCFLSIQGSPSTEIEFNLYFYLPQIYILDIDGCTLVQSFVSYAPSKLKIYLDGDGSKALKFYIPNEPYKIYVDGNVYKNYTYDKTTKQLTIHYNFGSLHVFEIEQFSPTEEEGGGGITPGTPSTPTVPKPEVPETNLMTLGIIIIIIVIVGAMIYSDVKRESLSEKWKKERKKKRRTRWKKEEYW